MDNAWHCYAAGMNAARRSAANARPARDVVRGVHEASLRVLLEHFAEQGLTDRRALVAHKARGYLDVALWKLAELDGKYGGDFVSEGVHALEARLGRPPARSHGMWPERLLRRSLGLPSRSPEWRTTPSYRCQLDHVLQRADLIDLLLREPARVDDVAALVVGCVLLGEEHRRLASGPTSSEDIWRKYRDANRGPVRVWSRSRAAWVF